MTNETQGGTLYLHSLVVSCIAALFILVHWNRYFVASFICIAVIVASPTLTEYLLTQKQVRLGSKVKTFIDKNYEELKNFINNQLTA